MNYEYEYKKLLSKMAELLAEGNALLVLAAERAEEGDGGDNCIVYYGVGADEPHPRESSGIR